MLETIDVRTSRRTELIDVTDKVHAVIHASGVKSGVVTCYVPHTTAAVTIQENADPSVVSDLLARLEVLAPANLPEYRHMEGNSDAHIKTSMLGTSDQVFIEDGRLVLGTWQSIYFAEFDGPRSRKMLVKVIAD